MQQGKICKCGGRCACLHKRLSIFTIPDRCPVCMDKDDKAVCSITHPVTVYYDGSCPLCRREIGFYRRSSGASDIVWEDVSSTVQSHVAPDLSCTQAMARFHVRDAQGTLTSGAAAFVQLWLNLKYWRWLGQLCCGPLRLRLLEHAYVYFLRWRPALQRRLK